MRDDNTHPFSQSDPLELVADLRIDDGINVIFDAAVIWATLLVPRGTSKVAQPLWQYALAHSLQTPAELAHWPVERFWEMLLGHLHRHIRELRIDGSFSRVKSEPMPCPKVECTKRAASLAGIAQLLPITEALELFTDVIMRWAASCNFEMLQAAIRQAGYEPDQTWTDQRYSDFIPYVLADMIEH